MIVGTTAVSSVVDTVVFGEGAVTVRTASSFGSAVQATARATERSSQNSNRRTTTDFENEGIAVEKICWFLHPLLSFK